MNDLALEASSRYAVPVQLQPRPNALSSVRYAFGAVSGRRRLFAIVAGVVFTLVAAFGVLMPRSYYAEAMLVIHPQHDNLTQPDNPQTGLPPDTSAIDSEVEIIRSAAVAEAVVRKLKLYQDPEFGGAAGASPTPDIMRKTVASVEGHSQIRRVGLTYVVQVGFVAGSVDKARELADAIVASYLTRKMDEKLATVIRANKDLGATLQGLRDKALRAESQVEDYMAKNGLLGTDINAMPEVELSALNQRIADAQADTAEKQARMSAALAQAQQGGGGSDVGATLASNTVGALRQKEADVSATLAQLETQFKPEYPLVQKSRAELNDIRSQLHAETTRILSSLRAEAEVASRREASLLASRAQVEDHIQANNHARVGLLALRQTADSAKKIYETYLTRASEVAAERSLQQVDATVESNALAGPNSPYRSLRFIAAMSLALAFVSGLIAVLIAEIWTRRIRSWNDVSRETGLPLAGVLPDVLTIGYRGNVANQIVENPLTTGAEAFRNLGAYLALSGKTGRSIAVTSAVPGEGKTMTSICLARTLATSGARTILLDCDLRHASASRYFIKPNFGISEIIKHSVPLDKALVRDPRTGLWFLSGCVSKDIPTDLFNGNRVEALLNKLAEQFDHIIIDTPPLLGFADTRIIVSRVDQVLHVVQWNKTPAAMVQASTEVLRQCNVRSACIVLNKVNVRQQALYGFADGSDYYYRYGAAYGQQV